MQLIPSCSLRQIFLYPLYIVPPPFHRLRNCSAAGTDFPTRATNAWPSIDSKAQKCISAVLQEARGTRGTREEKGLKETEFRNFHQNQVWSRQHKTHYPSPVFCLPSPLPQHLSEQHLNKFVGRHYNLCKLTQFSYLPPQANYSRNENQGLIIACFPHLLPIPLQERRQFATKFLSN